MENIFKRFKGNWIVNRSINDKLKNNITSLNGIAWFRHSYKDLNLLKYREEVLFKDTIPLFREYIYYYDKKHNEIKVFFNEGDNESNFDSIENLRLFVKLENRNNNYLTLDANHICKLDNYKADYKFINQILFRIEYSVIGPNKNYHMISDYIKKIDND